MTDSQWAEILKDWKARVSLYQTKQFERAGSLEAWHYRLGIPAVVLAAAAGTTAFANLNKDFSLDARLTVVIVSLLTAILTAVQTFMNYGKRAETHRSVSNQFGEVRREIDILESSPPSGQKERESKLRELNEKITKISTDAPIIEAPRDPGSGPRSGGGMIMLSR